MWHQDSLRSNISDESDNIKDASLDADRCCQEGALQRNQQTGKDRKYLEGSRPVWLQFVKVIRTFRKRAFQYSSNTTLTTLMK